MYNEAAQESLKAVNLKPDLVEAYNLAAVSMNKLGKWREADDLLERVSRVAGPADASVYTTKGTVLAQRGDQESALRYYGYAEKKEPDNPEIYIQAGAAYGVLGEYSASERSLKCAIALNPGNPDAHYLLALIYYSTGKTGLARDELKSCISLRAGMKDAEALLTKIGDNRTE